MNDVVSLLETESLKLDKYDDSNDEDEEENNNNDTNNEQQQLPTFQFI